MKNSREIRNEVLKQNGINTDNFYELSMRIPLGTKMKILINEQEIVFNGNESYETDEKELNMRMVATNTFDGNLNVQPLSPLAPDNYMNEEIVNAILKDGYIRNNKLFRRWITAQTFRMLNYKSFKDPKRTGWEVCMKDCYDYNYQFKMLLEEIRVLSILQKEDPEQFAERTIFFNEKVVVSILDDYYYKLSKYIKEQQKKKPRTYKGKPYVKLSKYGNILIDDLYDKVYIPIESKINLIESVSVSKDYSVLYKALKDFMDTYYNKLPYKTTKCQVWKDAFKAAGAFYSLQNTIRFTGMLLRGCKDKYESEKKLYELLAEYKGEEWRLHSVLVDAIKYNNYNFADRVKQYRKDNWIEN